MENEMVTAIIHRGILEIMEQKMQATTPFLTAEGLGWALGFRV